jgi:hypothetical protein
MTTVEMLNQLDRDNYIEVAKKDGQTVGGWKWALVYMKPGAKYTLRQPESTFTGKGPEYGPLTLIVDVILPEDLSAIAQGATGTTYRFESIVLDDIQEIVAVISKKEFQKIASAKVTEAEVKKCEIGKYYLVWVGTTGLGNPIANQGKLKSIDWNKRTLVLTSTVYQNTEYTIGFDRILSVEERSGPGAGAAVQEGDWKYVGAPGGGARWIRG